jgi:Cu/Ag efflux protein CusF
VEHHYPLTGKVVSLDAQHQTATVDAAAIPNFMEAMTMEYPVKSKSDFESLHVGERITATVDVTGDNTYSLSNVKPQTGSSAQK